MKTLAHNLLDKTNARMHSTNFKNKHRRSQQYFTRLRCMGFVAIMAFCLNFLSRTLQVELNSFAKLIEGKNEMPMSKQAFSKARHKISPMAFVELFELTSTTTFELDGFGRYKGFRVFAIDGTELQLPKFDETAAMFGYKRDSFSPKARFSILCDVVTWNVFTPPSKTLKWENAHKTQCLQWF